MEPLKLPTDHMIMELMAKRKRQTPKNISKMLDRTSNYVSRRLGVLKEYGYVEDPAEGDYKSGMYVVTEIGAVAARYMDRYDKKYPEVFEKVVENRLKLKKGSLDPEPNTSEQKCWEIIKEFGKGERIHVEKVKPKLEEKYPDEEFTEEEIRKGLYNWYLVGNLDKPFGSDIYVHRWEMWN